MEKEKQYFINLCTVLFAIVLILTMLLIVSVYVNLTQSNMVNGMSINTDTEVWCINTDTEVWLAQKEHNGRPMVFTGFYDVEVLESNAIILFCDYLHPIYKGTDGDLTIVRRDHEVFPLEPSRTIDVELWWNNSNGNDVFIRLNDLRIYNRWNGGFYAEMDNIDFSPGLNHYKSYNVTLCIDKLNLTDITIIEID